MKVELSYSELSKIERALMDKIDRVDIFIFECDDPDCAKGLLEYSENLRKLYSKIEAKLYSYELIKNI